MDSFYTKIKINLDKANELIKYYKSVLEEDQSINTLDQEKLDALEKKVTLVFNHISAKNTTLVPEAPPFKAIDWNDIMAEYNQDIQQKIESLKGASDRAKNYITQENESNDGNILFDSLLAVVSSFGKQYALGVKVLKIALDILETKPKDTITEFHSSWIYSLNEIKSKEYKLDDFREYFKNTILSSREEKEVDHHEVRSAIIPFLNKHFISDKQMEQAYTKAWIDSAKNDWGVPLFGGTSDFQEGDKDAGYISISTTYSFPLLLPITAVLDKVAGSETDPYEDGLWTDNALYIDDVASPKGTNEALKAAFGSSTPLEKLPFSIIAKVGTYSAPQNISFYRHGPQKYTKAPNGQWVLEKGDTKIFNIFKKYFKTKLVKDLDIE